MSIIWQITIVETLLNLAVFAVAVILYGLIPTFAARLPVKFPWVSDAAAGLIFGAATAAVMFMPIHLEGGASTGAQSVLLALSGWIAGPLAGFLALAITLLAQFFGAADGTMSSSAIPSTIGAMAAGITFHIFLGKPSKDVRETKLSYYHFPLLGLVCSVMTLTALWAMVGRDAVKSVVPAIIVAVLSCSALGTLLLHENRRNRAERELRESEARLAAQAADLAEARDAAEQANRSKSAFLANMSHELRTPLNAILGFSQMLAEEYLGPLGVPKYKEYAGDIYASGEHLLSLINDLLDVAKIEAGKMELAPEVLDPIRICEHVRMMMAIKARERKQQLSFSISPVMPPLYADERALKQILINLVSNAVKYTPEGGQIAVSFGPEGGGGVRIACIDTGSGIAPEKLDKIFTPFSQVDNRFNRQMGGTGLGLSLVRGLAELHGGRVWLESEFGCGCKAYVVLPPKKSAAAAAA